MSGLTGLDWDELQGTGKTVRARDLIVQLGRSGRLSELVELVWEERPRINWPDIPAAKYGIQKGTRWCLRSDTMEK